MTRACRELLGEFVDAGIPGLEQRAVEAGQLAAGNPRLAELDAENDAAWYVQDQREETANQVAEQTLRYHLAAWNRAVPVQAAVTAMTDRSTDPILGEAALDAAMRTVEARWQPFAAPPPDEVRTRRAAPASPAP